MLCFMVSEERKGNCQFYNRAISVIKQYMFNKRVIK